jgi:hypothetical protein
MLKTYLLAAVAALVVAPVAVPKIAQAATFSYKTIDNPLDPTFNQLLGINNFGVIAGYYGSGNAGKPNKGYTIAPPYTTFAPDDFPASVQTQATGINTAQITSGFWSKTNHGPGLDANFGFIRLPHKGTFQFITVNDPNVTSSPSVNQLLGINGKMTAVGFYNDAANNSHGFAYDVATATFIPINIGGAVSDAATGINNANLVSGFFVNKAGNTLGFVEPLSGGKAVVFEVPKSKNTQLLGVNNKGVAVGFYVDAGGLSHGLIFTPSTGIWTTVNAPGATGGTTLNGLNDKNQIVGFFTDVKNKTHGLLVTVTP